jgi:hypothetical protein
MKIVGSVLWFFLLCGIACAQTYPQGATPIVAVGTGTTGSVSATLQAPSGVTTRTVFICGFEVSVVGGTANAAVTVSGLVGGTTMTFQLTSATAAQNLIQPLNPCIPANGVNTNIVVNAPGFSGASADDVNAWGYVQ